MGHLTIRSSSLNLSHCLFLCELLVRASIVINQPCALPCSFLVRVSLPFHPLSLLQQSTKKSRRTSIAHHGRTHCVHLDDEHTHQSCWFHVPPDNTLVFGSLSLFTISITFSFHQWDERVLRTDARGHLQPLAISNPLPLADASLCFVSPHASRSR